MDGITLDKLFKAFTHLFDKVENIERLLQTRTEQRPKAGNLLTIQQAAAFLKLSVPTLYRLVSRSAIPVNKKGKRLCFSKHKSTARIKKDCRQAKQKVQPPTKTRLCSKQTHSVKKASIKNDKSSLIAYKRGKVEVTGDATGIEALIWTDSIFSWLRTLFAFVLVFVVPLAQFLSPVWQWFKKLAINSLF